MEYLLQLIFVIVGVLFANFIKKILKYEDKKYDLILLAVATFFVVVGDRTQVFRINNFIATLSIIIPAFLLGIVLRRLIYRYTQKKA